MYFVIEMLMKSDLYNTECDNLASVHQWRHFWLTSSIGTILGVELTPTQRHSKQATEQKATMLSSINTIITLQYKDSRHGTQTTYVRW